MSINHVTDVIVYVGVDDRTLALFENQYAVQPMGISYNSYLIFDEKIALLDTVDARATAEWLENVQEALGGKSPDYLIISHMEPDHAANLLRAAELYPQMQLVGNAKTFLMLKQFFGADAVPQERLLEVRDGDTLSLGAHTLHFLFAPMVHWPEVMVTYEETEKVLFSADAFGRFGALSVTGHAPWVPQARRYYVNIVGKYGAQVQALLKKVAPLPLEIICPLHGPVLRDDLQPYLQMYDTWSSYRPEDAEGILLAYASIHGNTAKAAQVLAEKLRAAGARVTECDLVTADVSYALASAFYCGKLILAAPSYDGFLFPPMEEFLTHLKTKQFQKRKVGLVENGSWAPVAGKLMKEAVSAMKDMTLCDTMVSIRSALDAASEAQMDKLVAEIMAD